MTNITDPREYADEIIRHLDRDGVTDSVSLEETRGHYMIEFRVPDPDPVYPSAVNTNQNRPRLTELTLRYGPLGNRNMVDPHRVDRLEGEWTDVVLDALSSENLLGKFPAKNPNIDVGDGWVDERIRPHYRIHHKDDGLDIRPAELRRFVTALNQGFERRFDTFEDRIIERPDDFRR